MVNIKNITKEEIETKIEFFVAGTAMGTIQYNDPTSDFFTWIQYIEKLKKPE